MIRLHDGCNLDLIASWAARFGVDGAWRLALASTPRI
jgi:hypothetical protein